MFFQCRQTNQRNVGITSFFLINFLWELRGARLRSPETIILSLTCFQCSYTRIKIKSFQIVWISSIVCARYIRIFPKIKRHNSLNFTCFHCKVHPHIFNFESSQIFFGNRRIARFFKVRYARTFLRIKLSNSLNFTCCHCKIHPHSFNFDVFLFVGNLCKNWIFQICAKSLSKLDMVTKINNSSAFCHNKSTNCELKPVHKLSLVKQGWSTTNFFSNRRISGVFKVRFARTFLRIKLSNSLNFMCCHCKVHPHNFNFDMFLFVGNLCKNWILQICLKSLPELDMVGKINNGSAFCHNKSPNCELNPVQKLSLVTQGLSSVPKLAYHRSSSF